MTPSSPSSHTATGVNVRAGVYDFALSGSHCLRVLHPIKQKPLMRHSFNSSRGSMACQAFAMWSFPPSSGSMNST